MSERIKNIGTWLLGLGILVLTGWLLTISKQHELKTIMADHVRIDPAGHELTIDMEDGRVLVFKYDIMQTQRKGQTGL